MRDKFERQQRIGKRGWLILAGAVFLIAPVSLGVHEFMLEGLHVPYPRPIGLPTWASYLNDGLSAYGLIVLCQLSRDHLSRFTLASRCSIISAIVLMLHETSRVLFIDTALTHAWVFQSVRILPKVISYLILCSTVVIVSGSLNSRWARIGAAAAMAVVFHFAIGPLADRAFVPVLGLLAKFDYPQLYFEPFPKRIFVPIYAGFIEPVIACFLAAALVWPRQISTGRFRMLRFAMLIMALKGSLLPTILWSFWIPGTLLRAILSEAQFGLETLVMALLTIVVWNQLDLRAAVWAFFDGRER